MNCSFIFYLEKSHIVCDCPTKTLWLFSYFHVWALELKRVAREVLVPFVALLVESRE